MELQTILQKVSRGTKRKIWLIGIAAIAGTGYGFFKLYKTPSASRNNYGFLSLLNSMIRVSEAASVSADTVSLLSNDMENFLWADSDEVPTTLKQAYKIAQCQEFHETVTGVSGAVADGVFEGLNSAELEGQFRSVVDKLFTEAGKGFASVVVGSLARNLVLSCLENLETLASNSRPPGDGSGFVDLILGDDRYREFVAECVNGFVGTAVAIYLDKTMDYNVYDQIFSSLGNPRHEAQMKGILMGVFVEAMETFIRVSHDILANGTSRRQRNSSSMDAETEILDPYEEEGEENEYEGCFSSAPIDVDNKNISNNDLGFGDLNRYHLSYGWIHKFSCLLPMSSKTNLLVDLRWKMPSEVLRFLFEFLLGKFSEFFDKTLPIACHDAVNRLLRILKILGGKSMAAGTVSIAMLWNALTGMRILDVLY